MADLEEEDKSVRQELTKKFIIALESVNNPQSVMQAIADRSSTNLRNELMTHIDSINTSIDVSHADFVRVPTQMQEAIRALREVIEAMLRGNHDLYMQRFEAIEDIIEVFKETVNDRFSQNDQNTEKAFNAAKTAVTERDTSNKEIANKSEANLQKLIGALEDSVKTLGATSESRISANKSTVDDKINDLKTTIAALDNRIIAGESARRATDPETSATLREVTLLRMANASGAGERRASDDGAKMNMVVIAIIVSIVAVISSIVMPLLERAH